MKKINVAELFAGVGGFRLGLEKYNKFNIVWSNQWEPSTKMQHASMVYEKQFSNKNHSNKDIATVPTNEIPDHDLLVGGFPCQDYSVATTLNNSKGLKGKKGVLWWSIHRILEEKKNKPKYLFLENVDRLLKSPDNASRTIITGEGGKSPSRFKHVINSDRGLRRLTLIELERLNMFPDNHTKLA